MSGLLIVGVGPGLGRSVAVRFAREGLPVSLVARRDETLAAVAADVAPLGVPVSRHRADAGRAEDVQAAVAASIAEHGVPDVVVYNAGRIQADAPGDLTAQQQTEARSRRARTSTRTRSPNTTGACTRSRRPNGRPSSSTPDRADG